MWLGAMDVAFLLSLAIGNMISGYLEDHYSLRYIISGGIILSSFVYMIMAILGLNNIYIPIIFLFCFSLQGMLLSGIWPGCISLLGRWFDKHNRGKIMGIFSLSTTTAGFASALISGKMLSSEIEWTIIILVFSLFQCTMGILFFIFIKDTPEGILTLETDNKDILMLPIGQSRETISIEENHHKKGIPFIQALKIPKIINFAIAFGCSRLIAGGLFIWLPFYLNKIHFKGEWIGVVLSLFEVGAFFGGITCGWLGDRFETRPPFISLFVIYLV